MICCYAMLLCCYAGCLPVCPGWLAGWAGWAGLRGHLWLSGWLAKLVAKFHWAKSGWLAGWLAGWLVRLASKSIPNNIILCSYLFVILLLTSEFGSGTGWTAYPPLSNSFMSLSPSLISSLWIAETFRQHMHLYTERDMRYRYRVYVYDIKGIQNIQHYC